MLWARIKEVKKILVILDDVWARLELATVGIPFGQVHEGCKIMITTRREQVCRTMGNEWERTKIVRLDVLSEQDSWDLFRKNVGNVVDPSALNSVAREVSKECGGLPIALVTVGSAMKGKHDPDLWNEAAWELRNSMPSNIEVVDEKVYRCLKWSYDYLKDEEAKACFLLCSLFPEDHDILIEDLVRYGMGLRVFKNVGRVLEARGRAKSVINNLKDSCLLFASDREGCIKMHDVVRDVAISVGSSKYFVRAGCSLKDWPYGDSLDQYAGISLMRNEISKIPDVLECPKLKILLLQDNKNAWSCSDEFFSEMRALNVLDLSKYYLCDNPIRCSNVFNNQICLRTLILDGIKFGNTKFLGQAKTLEVLSLKSAKFFETPNAIRELTKLRLLDMAESYHENLIPADVVSPLSNLEELYLFPIYSMMIKDPTVDVAVALRSWPRLKVLTICIPDIPKDYVFPELESFIILIGSWRSEGNYSPNFLAIENLVGPMVNWIKCLMMVLKRATSLYVERLQDMKNIFPNLNADVDNLNLLKHLGIFFCSQLEYLINTEEWWISPKAQPPDLQFLFNLEVLELWELETFKGICRGALTTSSWVCFPKFRRLSIIACPELSTVLLPFNLLQKLQHLEVLDVTSCYILEQVFDFGPEGEGKKMLSSLCDFKLCYLPRLKHIFNYCSSRHVYLCNLRIMCVSLCSKLKYVFEPSIAQVLHQLEVLSVNKCEEMEEIIAKKNERQDEILVDKMMVFKSLKEIRLAKLPNLSGFCTGEDFPFAWPSLEILDVYMCPKMKTFATAATTTTSRGIQSTPKLRTVVLDDIRTGLQGMMDLNQIVENHFKAEEKQTGTVKDDLLAESFSDYESESYSDYEPADYEPASYSDYETDYE